MARERYVIGGASRLTVRVARQLTARGADVVVAMDVDDDRFAMLLGPGVHVVTAGDRAEALRLAELGGATCLLELADDDLDNLHTTAAARAVDPDVPLVVRSFDPVVADQLEQMGGVRRAYSVSDLSAPAFVARALGDEVVETLRLGEAEVLLCRVAVRSGSPLDGMTARDVKREFGCAVVTAEPRRMTGADEILVGAPLLNVLGLVLRNSQAEPRTTLRRRSAPAPAAHRRVTLLPAALIAFVSIVAVAAIVFGVERDTEAAESIYFAFTVAWGNAALTDAPAWLQLFGVAFMLAVGALVGVLFSHLASVATAERLEVRSGRRARRLAGHVVVAGLGTVGYRIERLLHQLGLETVVLEREPATRFIDAAREHAPVLTGDARLPENLERVGIANAACIMAVTDEDLANVTACLHARKLNPEIRTVARIFDDALGERIGGPLNIDATISASRVAANAFVAAAVDDSARRSFRVGDQPYLALRFECPRSISFEEIERRRSDGLRVLAIRRGQGEVLPPSDLQSGLDPGDSVIVAGPEAVVAALAGS
jgi:Trk K+ transport system NAD-binding subunit